MILIKKRFKLFVHAKIEKKLVCPNIPSYYLAVSLKNRSFAAEIALDTFSMPTFLDLHQ